MCWGKGGDDENHCTVSAAGCVTVEICPSPAAYGLGPFPTRCSWLRNGSRGSAFTHTQNQTEYDLFNSSPAASLVWPSFSNALHEPVSLRGRLQLRTEAKGTKTAMQDRRRVLPPWRKALLAVAMVVACALLLLSTAGWIYLLVQQWHLAEDLHRLDVQVREVSRRFGVQEEAAELRVLQRSRRQENGAAEAAGAAGEAAALRGQEEEDVMVMMTYSLVSVRHQNIPVDVEFFNYLIMIIIITVIAAFSVSPLW